MQLSNHVTVKASPQEVFALVNDVERVVSCMPGAALTGREGEAWQGRVKVKVGPITAAYAGTVRFLEVDEERRTLRVQATGADTHGSGDAEAAVALEVAPAPEGAELRLETDLVIRGKIAQFGKSAVNTVSDKLLQQFAQNLGSLLDQDRAAAATPAPSGGPDSPAAGTTPAATAQPVPAAAPAAATPAAVARSPLGDEELNGLAMLVPPKVAKYAPLAGAFAFGLFEGWLLGRVLTREKQQALRGRAR
ncbi:SRPBCC family protein [Streptomyces sulphureus]|uniref:SRPBCC family protein n=1 Tax=Streptomyces sulphureus TaxID=47758 RepID=UPI0003748183|nr:SRPBCC family protein [Streptomyces sulphureus]